MSLDPVALSLFVSRMEAVCEEMGVVLRRTAFSPNIKDRLDFSCALFDPRGQLCAQAAHIPVHLGSMAFAMGEVVNRFHWRDGDMVILNDPFLGGTHLPDVTVIAPVFADGELQAFAVNRAHHANIGADTPGSMPQSTRLDEEGVVLAPRLLYRAGRLDPDTLDLLRGLRDATTEDGGEPALNGDIAAQASAARVGVRRLGELIAMRGPAGFRDALAGLNDYGERLALAALGEIRPGRYQFEDLMDDDGAGTRDIPIRVTIRVDAGRVAVDFSGTAPQVAGNINCPLSVAAAAVFYVFRCLMPAQAPACAGLFRPITLHAEPGLLVNAQRPAAVAAGNVETSTRIVDVVLGALHQALPERIPAASQGSMNNIALGQAASGERWDYYETLAGGMGGGPHSAGASAMHSHMTNTLNTPVESLEMHYPLRIRRYALRPGSGGAGLHRGGDGLVREYEFLRDTRVSLLTERRRRAPWGLAGGGPARPGRNLLGGRELPAKTGVAARAGERLVVETPGGGGWGAPEGER